MVVAAAAALALVVMINYLAGGHYRRFYLSRDTAFKLSSQTRAVLDSLTNDINITIFFDPTGANREVYGLSRALLGEYQNANPGHVHVGMLDYTRYAGRARDLLVKLNLNGQRDKDFVVLDSNGHSKIVYASQLAEYDLSNLLTGRSKIVRRNAFGGEQLFTSAIYSISNPQALKAYFLYGHGEHDPGNPSDDSQNPGLTGYTNVAAILKTQLDCDWARLSLLGTNDVPKDCQLLIIAGPRGEFLPEEVNKIAAYLKNGGRLLALLPTHCGLETMLAKQWGVGLGKSRVVEKDPRWSNGADSFFTAELFPNPIVNPLVKDQMPILMASARPIYALDGGKIPGAPEVKFLAATSTNAMDESNHADVYNLLAAVDQGTIKGVETPRGEGTHIVLAGESLFLDDQIIESWPGNHQFAFLALTWLLQRRPLLLAGLVPRPSNEYKIYVTSAGSHAIEGLFLAGMPASILILGGMVWLRRRH